MIFGDPDHQEVQGLAGWSKGSAKFIGIDLSQLDTATLSAKVAIISQTTQVSTDYDLFISRLFQHGLPKVKEFRSFNTICPIVAARIDRARKLARQVDIMFVVGSRESANTKNLARACQDVIETDRVHIIQGVMDVPERIDASRVGITAGTSTPMPIVQAVVDEVAAKSSKRREN